MSKKKKIKILSFIIIGTALLVLFLFIIGLLVAMKYGQEINAY